MSSWTPDSWRQRECKQLPAYQDAEELSRVAGQLQKLPPLVHPKECDKLRAELARACHGKAFVLWGGDCAEDFRF